MKQIVTALVLAGFLVGGSGMFSNAADNRPRTPADGAVQHPAKKAKKPKKNRVKHTAKVAPKAKVAKKK